jgi:hypothetical protein
MVVRHGSATQAPLVQTWPAAQSALAMQPGPTWLHWPATHAPFIQSASTVQAFESATHMLPVQTWPAAQSASALQNAGSASHIPFTQPAPTPQSALVVHRLVVGCWQAPCAQRVPTPHSAAAMHSGASGGGNISSV